MLKYSGTVGTNTAPNPNMTAGYQNQGYFANMQQGLSAAYPFDNGTASSYAQQYSPQNPIEPEFDLSQLGTIVIGNNDNGNRGYYFLLLSVDGERLAYIAGATTKYDTTVINWKTPSKMVEFLGEFDLLNQHWVDFKSKAIGYIMGKFQLDASK